MANLTIDGETFRFEVEGDDELPSVLLSNSLGTDISLWDGQMPALLEHFRVVRYDSRGHGRSTIGGAPYSIARLGADALAILDALAIERAHFIGVSMGGAVGQWLLINAPERIERAVLANTVARFAPAELWNERIAVVLANGMDPLAAATMERWFGAAFRESAQDRIASIEAVFRAGPPAGYAGCCAALRDMDLRHALRTVASPVLILSGREDPVTSAAEIATMTDAIRGARHVALDCRHISNIEAEAAFNAAVVAFLTGRVSARARAARPAGRSAAVLRSARARMAAARRPLKPAAAPQPAAPKSAAPKSAAPKSAAAKSAAPKSAVAKPARAGRIGRGPAARQAEDKPAKRPPAARSSAAAPAKPGRRKAAVGRGAARVAESGASRKRKAPAAEAKPAPRPSAKKVVAKPAKRGGGSSASTKTSQASAKTASARSRGPRTPAARRRPAKPPTKPGGRRR